MSQQQSKDTMQVTIRGIRRTLAGGMDIRARRMKVSREDMLRELLENEFEWEEDQYKKIIGGEDKEEREGE